MKWLYRAVFVVALMTLPMAGWGLTLDEATCIQLTQFDALGNWVGTLVSIIWGDMYGAWPEWDAEYIDGAETGDGVNDSWQMALLAAVLCADPWLVDPYVDLDLIRQQYDANLAELQAFGADLESMAPLTQQAGQFAWDIGNGLLTEFQPPILDSMIVHMPQEGDTLRDLANWLRQIGENILTVTDLVAFDTFAAAFNIGTPWSAGISGLNTGMNVQVDDLLVGQMTGIESVTGNPGFFENLADTYTGDISPELEQDLRDFAAFLPQISISMPDLVVFGDGTGEGPIAGSSDWNADGLTNKQIFDLVQGAGGTRPDFVVGVTREGPWFDPQAVSLKRYLGEDAQFTVGITDPIPPVSYQWAFEAAKADIPGATDDTLDVLGVTMGDAGGYSCTVTDVLGVYTSNTAALEVAPHLEMVEHPEGADVEWLGSHIFEVTTTGGFQPLMFQWFKDDEPIFNATEASYTTSMLTSADSGSYYVEVSDDHTDVQVSRVAVLSVDDGMPVAAGFAVLALLAGALAFGGAATVRSKR